MLVPNRNGSSDDYRYAYQGQEKDPETGKEAFELRLWDSRIGRWLTTDPKGQFDSPYLGMGNNPLTMIDPDGAWHKDADGNLVADPGDNLETYAEYKHISIPEATLELSSLSEYDYELFNNSNIYSGTVVHQNSNMTRAIFNSNNDSNYHNGYFCHGSVEPAVLGLEINGNTAQNVFSAVGLDPDDSGRGVTNNKAWRDLGALYSKGENSNLNAVFGKTIGVFGGGKHSAVFYGTAPNGVNYFFTKNGSLHKPQIMTEKQLVNTYGSLIFFNMK